MTKKIAKGKAPTVLTCISLDGFEMWAIILGNSVEEQGNAYDHGDINETVIKLLSEKHKAEVVWVKSPEAISPVHQKALKEVDSNWDSVF